MKILFPLILLFFCQNLYSQSKLSDTTRKIPFDTNKIKDQTLLSKNSDVFSYDSLYIWNDKRTLSEIMDERPGYFIYDMGLGERNAINYNGKYASETGIFRDGIQINDNFYQGFDIQNISVNEIDKIEEISDVSSFFYGINTFSKSINIISKDIFQPRPFSQLRFSQDRFGSVFADFIFSQPFSRKANVQLGITKHSIDGRYANSEFDVWRGRGRINFFLSPKLNAKLNFYLDNYDRELNDGLVYSPDKSILEDPNEAVVVNPDASEHLENYFYDLTLTGRFFKNKNSLTKLMVYSNNSLRYLNNPDTSFYPTGYTHGIVYGVDLNQNVSIDHSRDMHSDLYAGGNIYINLLNEFGNSYQNNKNIFYSFKTKYDFNYKFLFLSALLRYDNLMSINFLNAGFETRLKIINNKIFTLELNGGLNQTEYLIVNRNIDQVFFVSGSAILNDTKNFYQAGLKFRYKDLTMSGSFYQTVSEEDTTVKGINTNINWTSKFADITISYNYSDSHIFPSNYIKSDIAYKGILFRGKLNLKTGINLKYYNIPFITRQSQTSYSIIPTNESFPQQNQFIADFYVGARIGRANINITVANILNSLVYNAYLYPLDDRGGLLNSISRFTIVWDFIN